VGAEQHKKEHKEKPKRKEHSVIDRLFDSGPITQFFLDLIGAEAPVHDAFVNGLSEKTIIEPLSDRPEPKVEVHDEFTVGDNTEDVKSSEYRSKRSVSNGESSKSSNGGVIWKRVCVKRRQVLKPAPRTLTAADFDEFAQRLTITSRVASVVKRARVWQPVFAESSTCVVLR